MKKAHIRIGGMSCDHCVNRIEKGLKGLDGMKSAKVDLKSGSARIDYDEGKVSESAIRQTINDLGYEA